MKTPKKAEKAPQIPHFSHNVEGWCNFWSFYREIAEWIPDGGIWVEVGVYWGQSFGYAVVECLNRGKKIDLVAVDIFAWPHEGQSMIDKFHHEMRPVAGHYRAIQSASWDAAAQFDDASIDFVFIDADHIYEHVKKDILAWLPKVKSGGIIAGHYRAIQSASWDAASQFDDASIDFVFIDADHIYEHVKKDILAWLPKVKPGGIIAGHDYNPPHEVKRAADEIFGDKVIPIPSDDFDADHRPFFSWKVQL